MIQKILGAEVEKTFGDLTLKAKPLPYFAYAPILAENYGEVWSLGSALLPMCIVDFELDGVVNSWTSKRIAGSKMRLISSETLGCIPPDDVPEILVWISELHKLTEVEAGN